MDNNTRFQINDFIIYGGCGVCIVKDICVPAINGIDVSKKYYMLEPVYTKGDTIYSPVDNSRTVMRKIFTKEETEELIRRIPFIETFWVDDRKMREEQCKKALFTYNCYELTRIVKTLYLKKEALAQQKRPLGQVDEHYLQLAENLLHGELAISLAIPKEKVESYIVKQVKKRHNYV